ncbi:zinc finger protein 813-like [Tenebrio molitor]|uniref:zinc finger protein 813-like n=1 Tax=Tenebrio molitor TaxID=7067 RepID=UPI0036249216
MDVKCRLCLFKTERDESVNIFTPGKNKELISDTIMSFVPIELSRDDNLPQAICNVCLQKLNSIIEFRMIILNSDAQLKTQKVIVGRLKEALSAAIRRPQKLVQKSENQVCDDSANYESEEIKLDIHDVMLETKTENKLEPDNTIKRQNSERTAGKWGARHRGYKRQSNKKLYKCEGCDKTFQHKSAYIMHDRTHTREMPFRCDICNKGFAARSFMVYHRRIHLDERPFQCDECTKAFKFQYCLRNHKRIHQGIRPYKCDLCDKTFLQMGALTIHRRGHTGEKPYLCEYCSKGFTTSQALQRHHSVHKKGPYIACPTCGKSYPNSLLLKCHMKIHNAVRRHTCDTCKKSFTLSALLKRHMRTHTGETPYSCTLCDRKFVYRKILLRHVKNAHSVLPLV